MVESQRRSGGGNNDVHPHPEGGAAQVEDASQGATHTLTG